MSAAPQAPERSWRELLRRDLQKCASRAGIPVWKCVLTEPGAWAVVQFRIESAVQHGRLPGVIRMPLRLALMIWHRLVEMSTGISIPSTATIGPGLHIPHGGTIVLHGRTVMGSDCCITQGVTIGISGSGEHRGVPRVGDRVYIGANAVIVGKICVGNDVVIGANSLVNRDVPDHCTVLGVPATLVSQRGSEDYI